MYLPTFDYVAPPSLPEALTLLQSKGDKLLPLAGGTDVLVQMKDGVTSSPAVLSLKNLAELRGIALGESRCTIGAGTTVSEIGASPLATLTPGFGDLVRQMATLQVRNRATIGGNLCTASACADFPPLLMVCDATVKLASLDGQRELDIGDFFTGLRQTARRPDELLVSVSCLHSCPGTAYVKFGFRKASNISIAGVACRLELDQGLVKTLKVAVTACSPVPIMSPEASDWAAGKTPGDETWSKVADLAVSSLNPISDLRGSADYRLHLARVGVVRALRTACTRWEEVNNA